MESNRPLPGVDDFDLDAASTLVAVALGAPDQEPRIATHGAEVADPPSALFEIGSITKGLTGIALAQAVVDGRLELGTTIAEVIPVAGHRLPKAVAAITLGELATHSSGLPRLPSLGPGYMWRNRQNPYAGIDRTRLLRALRRAKAKSKQPVYSNFGFGVLSWALAEAYGSSFGQVLADLVFQPLGLSASTLLTDAHSASGVLTPVGRGGRAASPWTMTDQTAGAGGVVSTPTDMARLLRSLLAPEATSAAAAIEMASDLRAPLDEDNGIGLGWLRHLPDEAGVVWHNGATAGSSSFIAVNRKRGQGLALLMNGSRPDALTALGMRWVRSTL